MAQQRRIGGTIAVQVNGEVQYAKGNWQYNLGRPKREMVLGSDTVHGYKEKPQVAYVEGEITDRKELDLAKLLDAADATVTLSLANGKVIVLREAVQVGEGTGNTEEGNIQVRFEGASGEEIR